MKRITNFELPANLCTLNCLHIMFYVMLIRRKESTLMQVLPLDTARLELMLRYVPGPFNYSTQDGYFNPLLPGFTGVLPALHSGQDSGV
jgi:hypothetical protein